MLNVAHCFSVLFVGPTVFVDGLETAPVDDRTDITRDFLGETSPATNPTRTMRVAPIGRLASPCYKIVTNVNMSSMTLKCSPWTRRGINRNQANPVQEEHAEGLVNETDFLL